MYIGPGSDGSSADKLSLDLEFTPWDTAITFRPEWRLMSKTVFTRYDPFETWYTCQSDAWLDDVKPFYLRPMRCVIVVPPYPLAQEDTILLTDPAFFSFAKICIDDSRLCPELHKDTRDVEQESEERDPGKNGLQLTDDSVTRLRNEFATNDPNIVFSYIPYQDDDMERPVEMCSLEMLLLQNANESDKVIITADTKHTQGVRARS